MRKLKEVSEGLKEKKAVQNKADQVKCVQVKSICEFREAVMRQGFCIFLFMLQFTDGCHVSDHEETKYVTGYTGASVLLPYSCSDPQSTAQTFTWIYYREDQWTEVFQDDQYKNRLTLFNTSSPANLSLLISHLRKKDEGDYRCQISQSYTDLRVTIKGCDLDQNKVTAEVTGLSRGSVVLPCSCTEIQAKPEQLTWTFTPPHNNSEDIYPREQSKRHRGRVKLLNTSSPGNLSLQISNLNSDDQGQYCCSVASQHVNITLRVQVSTLSFPTVYILLSVLPVVLILAVLALIYWKQRGRRDVQKTITDGLVEMVCSENEKQGNINPESVAQRKNLKQDHNVDEVTYSTVVHVKAESKPAHIQTVVTEHSHYASIK